MLNRTQLRKIGRDIWARKSRSALVISSIFISVLGVIALLTMGDLITKQLEEDVKPTEIAMIDIKVTLSSGATVDNVAVLNMLSNHEQLAGLTLAEGRANFPIRFANTPTAATTQSAELRAYSAALSAIEIEPIRLIAGDWPAVGQNQLAVETRFADTYGFTTGDSITLIVGDTRTTYLISGLVFDPYSYKRPTDDGSISPGAVDGIYMEFDDLRPLLNVQGYNSFVFRYKTFEQAEQQFDTIQTVIRNETPYLPKFPFIENPEENGQILGAQTFSSVLGLLAFIAMIVSGFLVVNVVNTIVVEQKRQIGVMKSIGASQRDNFVIYGGLAFMYGLIGTLLAVIPSIIVGYELSAILAPQLDVLLEGFTWSPRAVILGMLLGIFVPVIAAIIPVYNGTRVTILDAVTDLGIDSNFGAGSVTRFIGRLPLPTVIRQGLSNVFQKKGRLALTGLTLTSAIGASMGVIAMAVSLNNGVTRIFDRLNYEITVLPADIQDIDAIRTVGLNTAHVSEMNPGVIVTVQIEADYENFFTRNNQVITFGVDPANQMYAFNLKEGTGWSSDQTRQGVIIAAPMADQIGLGVGDELHFVISGQRVTREIIGIENTAFDAMWVRWDELASLGGFFGEGPQPNNYSEPAMIEGVSSPIVAIGLSEAGAAFLSGIALPANNVLITEALAIQGGYDIGADISIQIAETTIQRTIAGIIPQSDFEALMQGQAPSNTPIANALFFDFSDLVSVTNVGLGQTPSPNGFFLVTDLADPNAKDIDAVIDVLETNLSAQGLNAELQNNVARFEEITDLIVQYTAILSLAAVLIGAVGAVGLLTTLTITVLERQKEIGVMRSIGASSYTVASQFLTEGLLVGFLAWLAGIPLSYFIAVQINTAFRLETVEFSYPPEVLVFGLLVMIVITILASLGPSLSAARKTVSEILRYQ